MSSGTQNQSDVSEAVDQFAQGDLSGFQVLYAHYGREILSFVASRCRGRLDPDDLAQDVWVRIMKSHGRFSGGNFRAWMYQISRNYIIDQFRKKGEVQLAEEFDHPEFREEDQTEELQAMKACLEQLGGPFVTVLMAQLDGESTQTIAEREQISVNTVYSRVSRAKELVKACVEEKLQ